MSESEIHLKIRRIALPPAEVAKLAAAERNLFFLVGHVNNEITSLYKVFSWCLNLAHVPNVSPIEANAANAQAMIYARVLAGKLVEAWGALQRSWFADLPPTGVPIDRRESGLLKCSRPAYQGLR